MDFNGIGLFRLADRRLAWTGARQQVLAQNIANADTPGWKPRDLPGFAATLNNATLPLAHTDAQHIVPQMAQTTASAVRAAKQERAPDGNAVSLEAQLAQVADTESAHELTTDLYRKYLGFFRTAIGR